MSCWVMTKPRPELDSTAASAADDRFEEILERIVRAGGRITRDETLPLLIEFNNEEVEIGERRVVEVSLNKMDFQIT